MALGRPEIFGVQLAHLSTGRVHSSITRQPDAGFAISAWHYYTERPNMALGGVTFHWSTVAVNALALLIFAIDVKIISAGRVNSASSTNKAI